MENRSSAIYEFGHYRLDAAQRRLLRNNREVALRKKLFDLLLVFVQHPGKRFEKEELIRLVWKHTAIEDNNLTVSITQLRAFLGKEPYIETVAQIGYRFTAEVRIVQSENLTTNVSAYSQIIPPGGAIPLFSKFYVVRQTDEEFHMAISRRDSIVLVKGSRQVGKTSLLARGLQHARSEDCSIVLTDFQLLANSAFANSETFLRTLAELIADQLETPPPGNWNPRLSPGSNFEGYLRREILPGIQTSLVWGLDEVDRLFQCDYAGEIFGLFRSWHNLRALAPQGPWYKVTLAMAYATEAHLFITDLNQSPFNVGTRLFLEDFSLEDICDLNQRYAEPLRTREEILRFHTLVGGHPYLVQRGLYEMVMRKDDIATIEAKAYRDEGVFGDHLQRLLLSLRRDQALCEVLSAFLKEEAPLTVAAFYRLRSAGVLSGDTAQEAVPRCMLYAGYLKNHLR
jgi:DNA-binding winged helix-turn-helix (wHTH) protein